MIACDNEGGCPFEWVRCPSSSYVYYIMLIALKVPSVVRGLEATDTRKVVLLRVQSKENWWYHCW